MLMNENYFVYGPDNYSICVEEVYDADGDWCFKVVDLPIKEDERWYCSLQYEDDVVAWKMDSTEKSLLMESVTDWCLNNGYKFNGRYFILPSLYG